MANQDPSTTTLPEELSGYADTPEATELLVAGRIGTRWHVGVVCKRTYAVGIRGAWEPLEEDDQDLVFDGEAEYYEAEPPFVAPVAQGNDVLLRGGTDVVVQGEVFPPGAPTGQTTVQFRLGDLHREIVVHGDRRLERDAGGRLRFTAPEPFESMPLRYDRAFGGVDLAAWMENAGELAETMHGVPFHEMSPYHYPRNPAGAGFLLSTEPYELEDLLVPNLEYAFDPVTPERMVVGDPERWPGAPLPAGLDWYGASWFPRFQYLGASILPADMPPQVAEQQHGWATQDLLEIPYFLDQPGEPLRLEYGQAASPGMVHPRLWAADVARGIPFRVVGMNRAEPDLRMELPREWPRIRVGLLGAPLADLDPYLHSVAIRPNNREVVMTWCALAETGAEYTDAQYEATVSRVNWRTGGGR